MIVVQGWVDVQSAVTVNIALTVRRYTTLPAAKSPRHCFHSTVIGVSCGALSQPAAHRGTLRWQSEDLHVIAAPQT